MSTTPQLGTEETRPVGTEEPDVPVGPAAADPRPPETFSRRAALAGPLIGAISVAAAAVSAHELGVPLRDPDGVAGRRLIGVLLLVVGLVALDIVVRAALRSVRRRPTWDAVRAVRRERWGARRVAVAGGALVGFYASYFAYRNFKSMVPLLRPDELFDRQLDDVDRALFLGHDPSALLHGLLGAGPQTHVLSVVYVFYVLFVPLLVGLALVFARNLRSSVFVVTAMSLNWPLGAASYVLIPSLGPIYGRPADFDHLPSTAVSDLQELLLRRRGEFLSDPTVVSTSQDIAAFASLHVSMLVTIVVAAHLVRVARPVLVAVWVMLALSTVSTIYFGWHYVLDDVAGVLIAAVAIVAARALTGFDARAAVARRTRVGTDVARTPAPSGADA